ncbi:ABC transporter permease subunit [Candidatus Aerophobetes bacterium]|nr:ABC transporter permease subunit [Candidatus Aerophobetes bacterium]
MSDEKFILSMYVVRTLARRDFYSSLRGLGLYITTSVSFIVASFILKNYLESIAKSEVFASLNPLNSVFFLPMVILSVYLALISAVSISRERNEGTLEVLFYGPVSYSSYILSKYVNSMLNYVVGVAFFLAYFFGIAFITNLGFSYTLVGAILMSIFSISCVVSFGLFISSFTTRVRTSVIWLAGIFLLFLGIQLLHTVLLGIPEETMFPLMVYFEKSFSFVSRYIIGWLSPFYYMDRGLEAVSLGDPYLYGMNIVYCIIYSAVLVGISIFVLEKRGVRA